MFSFLTNLFKTVKLDPSILTQALAVVLAQATSFRVGDKRVTATVNGVPHHMTLGEAEVAIARVLAGADGSITVGSVTITVTPWNAP